MGLTARLVESLGQLDPICAEWDALAVASGRPFAAPAWPLAWWRNLAPRGAQLRVILVEEEGRLGGVVPLYAEGRTCRMIGGALAPVEPAARAGLEAEVAEAATELLASMRPRAATIELKQHESAPDWAGLLAGAWPGRGGASIWVESSISAPRVDFGGDFEAWIGAKSSSFRRDIRRSRRKLDDRGGTFRFATEETLERDVREFLRLHRMRLADRGGSHLPDRGVEEMLAAVGVELLPSGRFRLLCLDLADEVIAANLLLAAGEELSAWNSGFDDAYRDYSPVMQCLLYALEDAAGRGEGTMSLGAGDQSYKYRLSNAEDRIRSCVLIPRRLAYPIVELRLLPRRARQALSDKLSPESKQRLRRLFGH